MDFVLVHGAWHGGWCWERVSRILRAAGHRVYAPTLTGLSDRSHLLSPQVGLDTHTLDIANLIEWEDLNQIVLCGHSYAGMVISAVAALTPDRLGALVYVDAFVPGDGESVFDLLPFERVEAMQGQAEDDGFGWLIPPPSAERFGVESEFDRNWVDDRCTPQPMKCFTDPVALPSGAREQTLRRYVRAAAYPQPRFEQTYLDLDGAPSWQVHKLETGHDIMISQPEQLSAILLDVKRELEG